MKNVPTPEPKPLGPITKKDMELIHKGWMEYIQRKVEGVKK